MIESLFAITLVLESVVPATISSNITYDKDNGIVHISQKDINKLPKRGDIISGNSLYRHGTFYKDDNTLFFIIKNPDYIENSNQIKKEDYGVLNLDTESEYYTGYLNPEFIKIIDELFEQQKSINSLDNK